MLIFLYCLIFQPSSYSFNGKPPQHLHLPIRDYPWPLDWHFYLDLPPVPAQRSTLDSLGAQPRKPTGPFGFSATGFRHHFGNTGWSWNHASRAPRLPVCWTKSRTTVLRVVAASALLSPAI